MNDEDIDLENENVLRSPVVNSETAKVRLDKFLAESFPQLSRNQFIRLIEDNQVTEISENVIVNHPDMKVQTGQCFEINMPEADDMDVVPEEMPLDIVYEDESLLVVNKPAGLVVHPGAGNWHHTLVNGLLAHCGDGLLSIGGVQRPGIVHRIDKDTSGLLVVAKTDVAYFGLGKQFQAHSIQRAYQAFVWGRLNEEEGRVEGNIGRSPLNRQKMAVVQTGGKPAVTHYERLAVFGADLVSHIRCILETGRTHQIRVHMSSIRHPLVGDSVYGHAPKNAPDFLRFFPRQALHAGVLGFVHPVTQQQMIFEAPLPEDLSNLLTELKKL